jgi:hypothetical protein
VIKVASDRRSERVFAELRNLQGITRRSVRHAWFELGKDLKRTANEEIKRKPKRGRTYVIRTKSGRRRRHVASAPGETHANLGGTLRRSLSWKVHGVESMDFGFGVSTSAKNEAPVYSPFVEYGTSRMAERPSLNNAINACQATAEQAFEENMHRELDG